MPCHVKMVDGHCDDGCGYLVRSNALNTEREVHKTLQSTVHDSMIIQIFILRMKSNLRMPWNGRHVVYFGVNLRVEVLLLTWSWLSSDSYDDISSAVSSSDWMIPFSYCQKLHRLSQSRSLTIALRAHSRATRSKARLVSKSKNYILNIIHLPFLIF